MEVSFVVLLMRDAVTEIISIIGPVLGLALIVGLIVSLLQAVTSIQEQTLTFLPKLLVILLAIALLFGPIVSRLSEYTIRLFNEIPNMAR